MNRLLRHGSQGEDVLVLQQSLNQVAGFPGHKSQHPRLVPDGMFGTKTYKRVCEFQAMNKLGADGIVGPKTLEVLSGVLGAGASPAPAAGGTGPAGGKMGGGTGKPAGAPPAPAQQPGMLGSGPGKPSSGSGKGALTDGIFHFPPGMGGPAKPGGGPGLGGGMGGPPPPGGPAKPLGGGGKQPPPPPGKSSGKF